MIKRFLQGFPVRVLRDDDAGGAGGGQVQTPPAEGGKVDDTTPKFTDKQLNDYLAANVGKETKKQIGSVLEAAGVKDISELGAMIKELKEKGGDDKNKSKGKKDDDADNPLKTELEETRKTVGALQERADRGEAMALAMKAGVTDEKKLERVVKLALSPAYEGTIAERIQTIVTEAPEFVKSGKPFGDDFQNQTQDITQTLLNQARRQAGLPEKK